MNGYLQKKFNQNSVTPESFPKRRVVTDLEFGFPSGSENYDFQFVINGTSDNNFFISITGAVGQKITINYGDGFVRDVVMTGSPQSINYTYTQFSTFNVVFSGATETITYFEFFGTIGNVGTVKRNRVSPQFVPKIPNMTIFRAIGKGFSGTIPSFNSCVNLVEFRCDSNQFSGELPSFENCTNLSIFYCSTNNLSGNIPDFSKNLLLTDFRVNNNQFSGALPSFETCVNLVIFRCFTNQFSGTLPSFNSCTLLSIFQIHANQFSGTLPNFASCTSLSDFQCYSNQFSGTLPSFATCTALTAFQCYTNSFSGTLPSFETCTSLTTFYCHSNQFSGTLPSFETCTALTTFQCHTNSFSGALPSFETCTSLTTFYCYSNQFSGALPSFNTCINLNALLCHGNEFSGTLPSFNGCINLNALYLGITSYGNNFDSQTLNDKIPNQAYSLLFAKKLPFIGDAPTTSIKWISISGVGEVAPFLDYTGCNFSSFLNLITQLYNTRQNLSRPVSVRLSGGTNAVPGGIYQAPAGYIQANATTVGNDGTPASEKEMIYVLSNQNIDNTTTKKYNYTFTTN